MLALDMRLAWHIELHVFVRNMEYRNPPYLGSLKKNQEDASLNMILEGPILHAFSYASANTHI